MPTRSAAISLIGPAALGAAALLACGTTPALSGAPVERFAVHEASFQSSGQYGNPYVELDAQATLTRPDGSTWKLPLFWDGESTWRLRVSPDIVGEWSYMVHSRDAGLDGQSGSFTCEPSRRRGSLERMAESPRHFQYQNGEPVWFLGDTAWALFYDSAEEQHNRVAAEEYLATRAAQGFNVVHTSALSEAGWINAGGPPFDDLAAQRINPDYWREADHRIAHANEMGLVVGVALAWGDKRKREPFAWRRFPDLEARLRYARYMAARYSAFAVYFLVAGEWHAEVNTRPSTEADVKREFIEIGAALAAADPHDRMVGIHPMSRHGSVREFNDADWMSFGDYQQNYDDLHARVLESRRFEKPVVNGEYGYLLRDSDGDSVPDKDNSTSLDSMRHASWDIVMAGGYLVTGFGTTYFGGNRDPGPFNISAPQNDDWERQIGLIRRFFTGLEWWRLEPRDEWLACDTPRSGDGRHLNQAAPPATAYWLLAEPGAHYVAYARGLSTPLTIQLGPAAAGEYRAELYNPQSGESRSIADRQTLSEEFEWTPPDAQDWILHLTAKK